jgi:NACalpha-BTF3-like transcription factor
MLQANPLLAQNDDFMEDLMKIKQEEAKIQLSKKEEKNKAEPEDEKKKPDSEVEHDSKIRNLMEFTLKSREEVTNALKASDWDSESAFMNFLMVEDIIDNEPGPTTVYKYDVKRW